MSFISTCVNYNGHFIKAIPIQFITLITVEKSVWWFASKWTITNQINLKGYDPGVGLQIRRNSSWCLQIRQQLH